MAATVLVVDDDEAACEFLSHVLNEAGYQVSTATSFHHAKQALLQATPDAMVVDIRLGRFNGLQLIIASEGRVPAIAISGFRDATLEEEARKLGADFLEKPIIGSDLVALLGRRLACT